MLGFSSTPSLPTVIPKALARFQQNCSSPLSVRFCPLRCLKWLGSFMWNLGNSKFSPLARSRRADRVCQQATQRDCFDRNVRPDSDLI
jgi:hypothetical protein